MPQTIPMSIAGTLGTNTGAASDGVLIGQLTATNPSKALLKSVATAGLCITDDGGLYVNETTPFGEATGDDVEVLPATPAVDDACYFGHATEMPSKVYVNTTTQGDGTWTITWEYWDGDSWEALSDVVDGTTGFTSATGWVSCAYTVPGDWAKCTVDGVLAYWVRARVSAYTSVTTAPQVGQGYVQTDTSTWTDDTTDFTDAGAGDVYLLPAYPLVGDGFYLGYSEKFCKAKVTTSQARTGTATFQCKYWNGSAWTELATYDDDSVGWSATAGTHFIHWVPPSDWVANTAANGPNGEAGFFIAVEMTAMTDVTAQPLATQGWIYPLKTGASGLETPVASNYAKVTMTAQTNSGTTQDSNFLLINTTTGICIQVTWTKGDPHVETANVSLPMVATNELAFVQVTEDGTTEFADANIVITVGA